MILATDPAEVRRIAFATWWFGRSRRVFPSGKTLHIGDAKPVKAVIVVKPIAHDPHRALMTAFGETISGLAVDLEAKTILEQIARYCSPELSRTDLSWWADILSEAARITKDEV